MAGSAILTVPPLAAGSMLAGILTERESGPGCGGRLPNVVAPEVGAAAGTVDVGETGLEGLLLPPSPSTLVSVMRYSSSSTCETR